jgi:hypothetical protein
MGDINSALGLGAAAGTHPGGSDPAISAMGRYQDGYRSAGLIIRIGNIIKTLGICLGIAILVIELVIASNLFGHDETAQMVSFGFAVVSALVVGVSLFVFGVIVSAQGQQLKASLDSAVHTSPFLDIEAKARAMSL